MWWEHVIAAGAGVAIGSVILVIGKFVLNRLEERRNGHRRNAEDHQGGAVEGAGGSAYYSAPAYAQGGIITIHAYGAGGGGGTYFPGEGTSQHVEEDDTELETYLAPVWGFRAWSLDTGSSFPLLRSKARTFNWNPGKNTARCIAGLGYGEPFQSCEGLVPAQSCTCGFYAVRSPHTLQQGAIGTVVGWGKIIDGVKGWRSEFAAVAALLCPDYLDVREQALIRAAGDYYQVPVCTTPGELVTKTEELVAWMAGDDLAEEEVTTDGS